MADKTIAQLDVIAEADVTEATEIEIQVPGLASPESRQLTIKQLREVLHGILGVRVTYWQPRAKVGTTAGWVVAAANDLGTLATAPQNLTAATLVIPLTGLVIGQVLTKFCLHGNLLATAGQATAITASLRKITSAAAGGTDALIEAFAAPVSVEANTLLSTANAQLTLASPPTIAAGVAYYLLISLTTANDAACGAELDGISLTTTWPAV